jgi:RHS repeat-associated protein
VANPYTVDYSYDALGRRYEKNIGGITASCYVYDGLNVVATTACYPAGTIYSYLGGTGLDELFLVNNGSSNESFLRDALDSTIALTDSSGTTILDQTTYDAYGNTTDSVPLQASPFEFTGRENDTTSISSGYYYSNLYFMRGRYYDPQLGRFISRDPSGLAGGTNMYEYAGDNPVDFSDPTGSYCCVGPSGDWSPGPFPWAGPTIPRGFTGSWVYPGLAPLANIDGVFTKYLRNNGGGLAEPGLVYGSIGVAYYDVIGGSVTFGRNPNSHFFLIIDVGFGLGGGVDVSPNGTSPGYTPDTGPGFSIGSYAQLSANFGPFEGGYGAESGTTFGPQGSTPYAEHGPFPGEAGDSFHLNFSEAAGARFAFVF